jgi:hypothetical protein
VSKRPTPEDLAVAKARLDYFERLLAEWQAFPDGTEEKEYRVGCYQREVAERRMLWALWEHLLGGT